MTEEQPKKADFYVDGAGTARIPVAKLSTLPDGTSAEILAVPAREHVRPFQDVHVQAVGSTDFQFIEERYPTGAPVRVGDVFDTMNDQAMRRKKGKPMFSALEVYAGRTYRDLHLRIEAAGMKGAAIFDDQRGGGGRLDFMDAFAMDVERLKMFHEAIGDADAKSPRAKAKAHDRMGGVIGEVHLRRIGKQIITVRTLVDWVCLYEKPLSAVLTAHSWPANERNRKPLKDALRAALGRMAGI